MHRLKASLLCLLSLSFAGSAFGQPADSQPDDSGRVTYDSYSGGATLGSEASGRASYTAAPPLGAGSYLFGRYMSGNGVGYQNGYSQFGGMVPIWVGENTMIGPDIRAIAGNNTTWGGNFGFVGRQYLPSLDRTIGAAGYYDIDQSYSKNNFHQGTFGLETLGQYWDARANVYYAPGTQDKLAAAGAPLCVSGDPFFQGNGIFFRGQQAMLREQAMSGIDAEFGVPVFPTTPWLRAYAGAYYYHAKQLAPVQSDEAIPNLTNANPVGFRGRLEAQVANDLLVGVNVTTDRVWGTNVNAMADFRFSGFHPTRYFPQWTTRDRMLSPWQRNWRIAIEQYGTAENVLVAAVDQTTGNPYFVSFIDNSNPNAGNGSFENPYNSFNHPTGISGADIIIVERGKSTEANPYLGSMLLKDNQILLGEGGTIDPLHLTATFGNCTVNADFTGFGTAGNYPFVSNQNIGVNNGNAVVLGNDNVVSGFNILGSAGNGIFGSGNYNGINRGINNFDLRDLEVFNNAGTGINLVNATGSSTFITDINQGVLDHANPNGTGNNAGGGIFVSTGVAGLSDLQLTNVNMNSKAPYTAPGAQQPYGIQLVANNGDLTTTLTNVTTNGNVLGLVLSETNKNLDATFDNVTANNNTGTGVQVTGTGGTVNLNTTGAPSITANDNGGSGMTYTQTGGTGTFALTNMIATGNGIDGIGLYSLGGGQIGTLLNKATITDGTFNLNIRDGIHTEQSGVGSALYLLVDPTQMNQNGNDGLYSKTDTGALANITVQDSTMNNNKANGSEALVSGIGSIVNRDFINSTLTNPAAVANGFKFNVTTGGQLTSTFDVASVVTANGNNGLNGTVDGAGSTATVTIIGTDFSANQKDNVNLAVTNAGNLLFTAQNSGATRANFSDSVTGNGVTASSSGGNSVAVLNLTGVDVNGNALTGISNSVTQAAPLALLQVGAVMHLNLDTVSVSNNLNGILSTVTQSGPLLAGQTGATLFDDTVNSTVDNNTQVGFGSTVTNSGAIPNGQIGATLYADLEGTSFSFNGLQGLAIHTTGKGAASYYGVGQYSIDGGATLTGTISHVDNNGNATGADGVRAVATDSGEINFRSGGSTFDNNGNAGSGSGLNFLASQIGPPGGTIRTLMYGGEANGNANNGIQFSAADLNSNVAIGLANGFTAVGNVAGYGLNVNITAANSYNLLIDPTPPPVVLQSSNVVVNNAAQVVSQVSGSFNAQAGNGYDFIYSNIGTAVVSFDGLGGTVNNNLGNGLNVQLTNVTNGAVLIKNYSDISGNSGYGINIDFTKVTNGAIEIDGLNSPIGTTMTNNGSGAVNIQLEDTNLIAGFSNLAGVNLKQLTIFDNNAVDVSTPLPVIASGSNIVTPTQSLTINHLNVNNTVSNGTGIVVATTGANKSSTIAAGATITNNRVIHSTGSGIGVTLANTTASTVAGLNGIGGLTVSGNTIGSAAAGTGNTGYGINVAVSNTAAFLSGSSADGVVIANNTVTNNTLGGINFQDIEAPGSLGTANGLQITGNNVTRNTGNGITATLQNLSTANNILVTGNTVGTAAVGTGNTGAGIDLVLTNLNSNSLSVSTNSIVNNGGDGLSLTQTNVDLALLTGTNDTITGNGGNGLVIDLLQGSNITSSTFTDAAITGNTLNGVVVTADDGTTQTIGNLLFTSTGPGIGKISGNGSNGVTTQLGTASSLNLGFTNETIQDNGVDGLLMTLNSDATATLAVTGSLIGNTVPGGTQQNGIAVNLNQTTASGLTDLVATITNSTLTNNSGNGITSTVSGPSILTVAPAATGVHFILDAATVDANGATGIGFNVNTGGRIDLAAVNGTTIDTNGLYGVYVVADGANTIANVNINNSFVDGNGLGGFVGVMTAGAHLNACLDTSSFSNSGTGTGGFATASGLDFTVDAGSRADIDMTSVTANSNANNGLRFDVSSVTPGGIFNLRSNGSTFNNNGQATIPPVNEGDGVHGAANGLGTVATLLFYGDTANTNNGDGFDLQVQNSGVLTVQLQNNVTANNNVTGNGLHLEAKTGASGNLLMTGGGTFTGNGGGNTFIQMNGVTQAVIQLSGDFSNSSADGIPIVLKNITGAGSLALVSILEGTTVNGNAGNGINITMDNITNGGVFIGGLTSVSGNGTANSAVLGQDGIKVTMSQVAHGALTIDGAISSGGNTVVNNNTGNGVNVLIDQGTVLNNVAFNNALLLNSGSTVNVMPDVSVIVCPVNPTDPLTDPLFGVLPTLNVGAATTFNSPLSIQNLDMDDNGKATGGNTAGNGIQLAVTGPATQVVGSPTINHNVINNTGVGSSTTTHSGIAIQLAGAADVGGAATPILIDTNTITNSTNDGIQILNPSTLNPLVVNVTGNTITGNGSVVANTGIGMGIDVLLNNVAAQTQNMTLNVLGDNGINTISNNKSFGVHLDARQMSTFALNVTSTGGQQIIDGNADAGIGVEAGGTTSSVFSTGSVNISNVLVENTRQNFQNVLNFPFQGDGLGVQTTGYAVINNFVVGDATTRNTTFLNNGTINAAYGGAGPAAGDGINIHAIDNSKFQPLVAGAATIMIQNTNVTGNLGDGINLFRTDNALMSIDSGAIINVIDDTESFVHVNNVQATGNHRAGLNMFTTGGVLPVTRLDIKDSTVPFNSAVPGSVFSGNGIGMKFVSQADAVLVANVLDTVTNNNGAFAGAGAGTGDGIYVQTDQRATFGDMLQPVSGSYTVFNPLAVASKFLGLTSKGNTANGLEIVSNDASKQKVTMTNSTNTARNVFDNNKGDGIKMTNNGAYFQGGDSNANLFMQHVDVFNSSLGTTGDGVHVTTNDSANTRVTLLDAAIGAPRPANSTTPGLTGNGINLSTNGSSNLNAIIGDQTTGGDPANAPDISIYGNKLNGILVTNSGSSTFSDVVYNVSSRFNAGRGYSALMSGTGNNYQHGLDHSLFDHNTREGIGFVTNTGVHNQAFDLFANGPNVDQLINSWGTRRDFLRLNTDLLAGLTLTNSTITNNGTFPNPYSAATPVVNGLLIDVSTNSHVNADIRSNVFGGNKADDMRTQAHIQTSGGFDANGNPTGAQINTNASINAGTNANDQIFLNETAQMDMRFMFNKGDHIFLSASALESDAGGGKPGPSGNTGPVETAIFSVNTFHYGTVAGAGSTTVFNGTPRLALDAAAGTIVDPLNGLTVQSGLVNSNLTETNPTVPGQTPTPTTPFHINGFYTNSDPNANTPVRIDFRSGAAVGQQTTITAYNSATGQFTLSPALLAAPGAGDIFRIHLLDTNTFDEPANPKQNIEQTFQNAFTNLNTGSIGSGGAAGAHVTFTPLDAYFTFPDTPFLP